MTNTGFKVLYVNTDKVSAEQMNRMSENISRKFGQAVLVLPMDVRLLLTVSLPDLYIIKEAVDASIRELEENEKANKHE